MNQVDVLSQIRGINQSFLKKLGLASNNETYVINILRFIDVIDEKGKKTGDAAKVFNQHDDAKFRSGFEALIKKAYSELFSLHGENSWTLNQDSLIQYFRTSDETSAIVGKRQATVFRALSALSGHAEVPIQKGKTKNTPASKKKVSKKAAKQKPTDTVSAATDNNSGGAGGANQDTGKRDVGLTVRVEINLPADGDQETYDRIFKSIRENLIDAS
jgi:hypothetical protein